ncbi:MAG: LysR family transcriptional regulator [Psychromonas sp.]
MGFNAKLLDGLVIFVEVINAGSFTHAAKNTGHSTSYISKEINKLEERLGVRLINRTTRSISLTEAGLVYFQSCEQLINEAQQSEDAITGRQIEPQGLLSISMPIGFALAKIRPVLAEFIALYPKIKLDLEMNDRKVDLISDGFDLAIRGAEKLDDSSLICKRFMSCQALVVASADYLQAYGTPTHPSELVKHKTIVYSYIKNPNNWSFSTFDKQEIAVTVDSHVSSNSGEMQLALCLAGQGVSSIPDFYLTDEIEKGLLVELFTEYKKAHIDIFFVYPSRKHMPAKVRCFIEFIEQKLGEKRT